MKERNILQQTQEPCSSVSWFFRCASISCFQVVSYWVSEWVTRTFSVSTVSTVLLAHLRVDFQAFFLRKTHLFHRLLWQTNNQDGNEEKKWLFINAKNKQISAYSMHNRFIHKGSSTFTISFLRNVRAKVVIVGGNVFQLLSTW